LSLEIQIKKKFYKGFHATENWIIGAKAKSSILMFLNVGRLPRKREWHNNKSLRFLVDAKIISKSNLCKNLKQIQRQY
jgi:hypothetical protein